MKRRVKLLLVMSCLLLCIGIGLRVFEVNKNQLSLPTKHYKMGEWVDIGNTHLYDIEEYRQGYSVRVSSAEIMSSTEYITRYGRSEHASNDEGIPGDVLVLEYEIKNVGNSNGYIDAVTQWAIGTAKNYYLHIDTDLWSTRDAVMKKSPVIHIKPHTEFSTYIPLANTYEPFGKPMDIQNQCRHHLKEKKYELIVANGPIRQIIDIEVPEHN